MTQQADGQVLIRAEMDTASVTAGIADMQAALDALRAHAARQFASIRAQVQSEGNTLGSWMPSLASRLIDALTGGLSGGSTRITGALRGVLASALSGGNDYAPRFSGIGSQVIAGIISGIQGNASSLWSTLRAVAANMLTTLKSALGIRSPSQLMREEIGWQIGAGVAQGILERQGDVASAAQTLADTAVTASKAGASKADTAKAGAVMAAETQTPDASAAYPAPKMIQTPQAAVPTVRVSAKDMGTAEQPLTQTRTVSRETVETASRAVTAKVPTTDTGSVRDASVQKESRTPSVSRETVATASRTLTALPAQQSGRGQMRGIGSITGAEIGMAGTLLYAAAASPASNVTRAVPTVTAAGGDTHGDETKKPAVMGGNTFIFQKPVETPYRHAQAIREVMEEMLYGT